MVALKFFSSSSLHELEAVVNSNPATLSNWFVTFNPNETEVMLFNNRLLCWFPKIYFQNNELIFVKHHRHLGITFSSDGKWQNHIENIGNKCSEMIGGLRELKLYVSRKCLNGMYLSYAIPLTKYANGVWDGLTEAEINSLENFWMKLTETFLALHIG